MLQRSLLHICYYGYFVIGLVITAIGPLIPVLQETFGLSLGEAGTVFVAQGIGYAVAVMLGGALSDRIGRRPVLLAGSAGIAVAFLAFFAAGSWPVALFLFFVASVGAGTVESAINSLAVDLAGDDAGRVLNLLHFFPAAGAVVGPYFAVRLLPFAWHAPFLAIGALLGIFFLLALVTQGGPLEIDASRVDERPNPAPPDARSFRRLFTDPSLWILAALLALYVGAEASITGWTFSFAVESLQAPRVVGTTITSLFWLGLMAGRVICSRISRRLPAMTLTAGMGAAAFLAYLPVIGAQSTVTLAAMTFVCGALIGGVFPTVVAHAAHIFPERVGAATGFIIAVCSIGGAAIPAAVGAIADGYGLRAGLIAVLLSLIGVASLAVAAQSSRKAEVTA